MQTQMPVIADGLHWCKAKKKILSALRMPFRHAPFSHRNAFRFSGSACFACFRADHADQKPRFAIR
jgi:hypothetical protein